MVAIPTYTVEQSITTPPCPTTPLMEEPILVDRGGPGQGWAWGSEISLVLRSVSGRVMNIDVQPVISYDCKAYLIGTFFSIR